MPLITDNSVLTPQQQIDLNSIPDIQLDVNILKAQTPLDTIGSYNVATNTPDITTTTMLPGKARTITAGGSRFGLTFNIGDLIYRNDDNSGYSRLASGSEINDTTSSLNTTYSSTKIDNQINDAKNLSNNTIQGAFTPNDSIVITGLNGKTALEFLQGQLNTKNVISCPYSDLTSKYNTATYNNYFAFIQSGTAVYNWNNSLITGDAKGQIYRKDATNGWTLECVSLVDMKSALDGKANSADIIKTNSFNRWVDSVNGSNSYLYNNVNYPYATITKALTGAQYPLKMNLIGQSFTDNITLTSSQSNITIGCQLTGESKFQSTWYGSITTSLNFTRLTLMNIELNSGAAIPVVLGSGDLGRHQFNNVALTTTNSSLMTIPTNFTNWIDLYNVDLGNSPSSILTLPSITGSATLNIKGLKGILNIELPTTPGWTIFVDALSTINWIGGYKANTIVQYTGTPQLSLGIITDQSSLTSLLANASAIGLYVISGFTPTGLTGLGRGDIIYHIGANINAIIYPFAWASNVINVIGQGTLVKTTNDWSLSALNSTTVGSLINTSTSKTTPINADKFSIWDSISTSLQSVSWTNIKATLKTYFDTLYLNQNTTGSAATLTTPRLINGVSFNGSADINIENRRGTIIPSASTITIGTVGLGESIHISGTTTITSLGNAATGTRRLLIFDGALILTHNATSLILPGNVNITTSAGDSADFICDSTNNWKCLQYTKASINPTFQNATSSVQTQLDSKIPQSLTSGYILVGNTSNVATGVPMSSEATITPTGAVTLVNNSVIAKLLTGFVASTSALIISATDSILNAFQKIQYYITKYLTNFNGSSQLVQLDANNYIPINVRLIADALVFGMVPAERINYSSVAVDNTNFNNANQLLRLDSAGKIPTIQNGNITVGASTGGTPTTGALTGTPTQVTITFSPAFTSNPTLIVTPRNEGSTNINNTYSATIRTLSTTSATINIIRTDIINGTWTQSLSLHWVAFPN